MEVTALPVRLVSWHISALSFMHFDTSILGNSMKWRNWKKWSACRHSEILNKTTLITLITTELSTLFQRKRDTMKEKLYSHMNLLMHQEDKYEIKIYISSSVSLNVTSVLYTVLIRMLQKLNLHEMRKPYETGYDIISRGGKSVLWKTQAALWNPSFTSAALDFCSLFLFVLSSKTV